MPRIAWAHIHPDHRPPFRWVRRLLLHRVWHSRAPPAVQVTVVTGLNPSRLDQLEMQCRSFSGPISAAVYLVMHNPGGNGTLSAANAAALDKAAASMDAFHQR